MRLARLVSSGFGAGFVPAAPGSVGSAVAAVLGAGLLAGPGWVLPCAATVVSMGGVWAIRAAGVFGDPGWVTIDEFAGQWIALLGLARPSVAGLVAAFVVFRLLDVAKPGPVGWADRQGGPAGVMADDLIAGGLTAGVLWAVRMHWPGVFG
jgi:phosphatidylglycerophosphatase A